MILLCLVEITLRTYISRKRGETYPQGVRGRPELPKNIVFADELLVWLQLVTASRDYSSRHHPQPFSCLALVLILVLALLRFPICFFFIFAHFSFCCHSIQLIQEDHVAGTSDKAGTCGLPVNQSRRLDLYRMDYSTSDNVTNPGNMRENLLHAWGTQRVVAGHGITRPLRLR